MLFPQFPLFALVTSADSPGAGGGERETPGFPRQQPPRANKSRSAGCFAQGSAQATWGRSGRDCAFPFGWGVGIYLNGSYTLGARKPTSVWLWALHGGTRLGTRSVNVNVIPFPAPLSSAVQRHGAAWLPLTRCFRVQRYLPHGPFRTLEPT